MTELSSAMTLQVRDRDKVMEPYKATKGAENRVKPTMLREASKSTLM